MTKSHETDHSPTQFEQILNATSVNSNSGVGYRLIPAVPTCTKRVHS